VVKAEDFDRLKALQSVFSSKNDPVGHLQDNGLTLWNPTGI
jgi:hypothetical protein